MRVFQSTLPTRGSDVATLEVDADTYKISIHAPHEGERRDKDDTPGGRAIFQSTLPTRGSDNPATSANL